MKKIGEATILIVADVIYVVILSIRVFSYFCSWFNSNAEQSSLKKRYCCNSVFCSHAFCTNSPLKELAGIF
jgi:hypothetical protein